MDGNALRALLIFALPLACQSPQAQSQPQAQSPTSTSSPVQASPASPPNAKPVSSEAAGPRTPDASEPPGTPDGAGVGQPIKDDPEIMLKTPEQAIARFREDWPRFSANPEAAHADDLVSSPRLPPQVVLREAVDQQLLLMDRLGDNAELYLHGAVTDLDGVGPVWVITYDGMLTRGLGAALSREGDVLLLWIVPEG